MREMLTRRTLIRVAVGAGTAFALAGCHGAQEGQSQGMTSSSGSDKEKGSSAMHTFTATTKALDEGCQVDCTAGSNHNVLIDEPVASKGTDKGMNPVELLLCSLGACSTLTAAHHAEQHDVDLKGVWIDVEGDIDPDDKDYHGFKEIRMTFHFQTESSQENCDALVKDVESSCPVSNTLSGGVLKVVANPAVIEPM